MQLWSSQYFDFYSCIGKKKKVNQLPIHRATNRAAVKGLNNCRTSSWVLSREKQQVPCSYFISFHHCPSCYHSGLEVESSARGKPDLLGQLSPHLAGPATTWLTHPIHTQASKTSVLNRRQLPALRLPELPGRSSFLALQFKAQSNHWELDFISYHEHPTCYCWCTDNHFKLSETPQLTSGVTF